MSRKRSVLAFVLAILVAVGAVDVARSIGKYAWHIYLRRPPTRITGYRGTAPVVSGDDSVRLVELLGYRPQSLCNSVDTPIEFELSPRADAAGETGRADPPAGLEFRLWEYGAKWSVVYDWRPWPLPPYRASAPGLVALQVDVRRKDDPDNIDRRWLNQFAFVRDNEPSRDSAPLVRSLGYRPQSVCNAVDTPIEFDLALRMDAAGKKYVNALEDLEFRLCEHGDKWSVVDDWRPWPLPPYRASHPGSVALQVDVRRKDDPENIDSHWLNEFVFLPGCQPCPNQLFRSLIAMHSDVLDEEKLCDLLADELQLVVALLHNDRLALEHGEQVQRLRRLPCVRGISADGPKSETITLRSGPVLHWNGRRHWLREEGRAVALRVGVADSPEYGDLFVRCAKLPEDAVAVAATASFVQSSYYYGTPSHAAAWSARNSVASCHQLALVLQRMLSGSGAAPKLIEFSCASSGGSHVMVHAVTADSRTPLLIDPTVGCLYVCKLAEISPGKIPAPIALPNSRAIPGCDLRSLLDASTTILAHDSAEPHVFPTRFGSTTVILQPKASGTGGL
jgi:hypothetical protein